MTNQETKKPCNTCDTLTSKNCSKCKIVHYCNRSCQANDWAVHKFFCASLPFPVVPKSTDQNHNIINYEKKAITGILFNENSTVPELIKIPLSIKFENMMLPATDKYMGAPESHNYMQSNPFTKRNLKDTLVILFRDNFLNDGSLPNKCIQNLSKGINDYPWKGPVIVIKMKGLEVYQNIYEDMNVKDFKDVIDYFCWYGKEKGSNVESTLENLGFQTFDLNSYK